MPQWSDNNFGADNSSRSVSKKWNKEDPNVRYPAHLEAYGKEEPPLVTGSVRELPLSSRVYEWVRSKFYW